MSEREIIYWNLHLWEREVTRLHKDLCVLLQIGPVEMDYV